MPQTIDSYFQTAGDQQGPRINTPNTREKATSIEQVANRDAAQRQRHDALERRLGQLRSAMGDAAETPLSAKPSLPEPATAAHDRKPVSEPIPKMERAQSSSGQAPTRKSTFWLAAALIPTLAAAGAVWWKGQDTSAKQSTAPMEVAAAAPANSSVAAVETPAGPTLASVNPPTAAPTVDASTESPSTNAAIAQVVQPPAAETQVMVDNAEDRALAILEDWRAAWSNRDADSYLSHYSASFESANGQDRAAWSESRRQNFAARSAISVKTYDVHATRLDETRIQLAFLQDYESGSYSEKAQPKVFLLVQEGNDWRIAGEWQGTLKVPPGANS